MRKRWLIGAAVVLAGLVAVVLATTLQRWRLPRVRAQIERILSDELGSQTRLAELSVALGPTVRVFGTGLTLHHREHPDAPPLVRIDEFEVEASLLTVWRDPYRIEAVRLRGLHIFIPPGGDDHEQSRDAAGEPAARGEGRGLAARLGGPARVVIGELESEGALLEIGTNEPDRAPRRFEIHDLRLRELRFDRPTTFDAHLTNPTPAGTILASGTFGPWNAGDPALTPVGGEYRFENADLGTIDGIGGLLDSQGEFSGRLQRIQVKGTTTTPAFSLEIGGTPVPLETAFAAIVDGTNGDTHLDPVEATLAETPIRAVGGVLHVEDGEGRVVVLDVAIEDGRLEDVLRLALENSPAPMSGALGVSAAVRIPPGGGPVAKRLELDGTFSVTGLAFASDALQEKVDDFSRRARGTPSATGIADVPSTMRGGFRLRDGRLRLTGLTFTLQGAAVRLDGSYVLASKALDFRGTVRMDARLSETMKTGWKSTLLKLVDPIFAKDGAGAVVPVKIGGTASSPDIGLDVGEVF